MLDPLDMETNNPVKKPSNEESKRINPQKQGEQKKDEQVKVPPPATEKPQSEGDRGTDGFK